MNKKIFFLLIGWMLMASCGLYAQSSEFVLDDEEEELIVPQDTVTVVEPEITILERVWGINLEGSLEDEIIRLSKSSTCERIAKSDISKWVYRVKNVPTTKTKNITVYLSLLKDHSYFLSLENPVTLDEVCKCYLELTKPDELKTSGKHQTDDEFFGTPASNGRNQRLIVIEF